MATSDLAHLSAARLGSLIRSREVSPVEVTRRYLDRIERLNPTLNAFIHVGAEDAIAQAKAAETEVLQGTDRGELHGVPVALKDQANVAGWPTTGGSRLLEGNIAAHDARLVSKLRQAGVVLLGKLNMSEFAAGPAYRYGIPRNPWNLACTTGGSSAGSGSAPAAFLCAAALGSDTTGSIRQPAAFCGIVGLRPTQGLVSNHGVLPLSWSMDTFGPMARTVEDCALLLRAIAEDDRRAIDSRLDSSRNYQAAFTDRLGDVRVGVILELTNSGEVDAEVGQAVRKAAEQLEQLGAVVSEISIPILEHGNVISRVLTWAEGAYVHFEMYRDRMAGLSRPVRTRALAGRLLPAHGYYKALRLREVVGRHLLEALQRFDILVSPAAFSGATAAFDVMNVGSKDEFMSELRRGVQLTTPFNQAGVPAISVPCGFTSDALPIGLQIASRPYGEATVLRVAYAYEQATPWHRRRPPIA